MTAEKFTSYLKPPILSLFLKAAVFAVLLDIVRIVPGVWSVLLVVIYAAYLYASRIRGGAHIPVLYWSYIVLALMAVMAVPFGPGAAAVIVFFSALLFLVLGSSLLRFAHNDTAFSVFFYFLLFGVCVYAASLSIPATFIAAPLVLFFIFYFFTKEYMVHAYGEWNARLRVSGIVISFLAAQVLWGSSLLSIGFLNAAALTIVFFITFLDMLIHAYTGALTRQVAYRNAALFAGCVLALVVVPGMGN